MKRGKNYLQIPANTTEEVKMLKSKYLQIGCALKLAKEDISSGCYKDLGIKLSNDVITFNDAITPPLSNGRYSRYNIMGRSIIRRDLPKIPKWFSHDIYPYGDTSRDTVIASYVRDVWQREEWMPEFLTLNISLKKEDDNYCYFVIKCEEILDTESSDFEFRLLYDINLVSENCGGYQLIKTDEDEQDIFETLYVNWELLPPGHFDINKLIKKFESKSTQEQRIITERFEYLKSFKPKTWIKGTNRFTQYFGAIMDNDIVVLENIHSGNAIYVFYQNWESLSKLSRTELIKMNSSCVKRISHTGRWKELLEKIINSKA